MSIFLFLCTNDSKLYTLFCTFFFKKKEINSTAWSSFHTSTYSLKAAECLDEKSFPSFRIIKITPHILRVLAFVFVYLMSGNYFCRGLNLTLFLSQKEIQWYQQGLLNNPSQCRTEKRATDHLCVFVPCLVTDSTLFGSQDSVMAWILIFLMHYEDNKALTLANGK